MLELVKEHLLIEIFDIFYHFVPKSVILSIISVLLSPDV
jgi:hypothetical protein